MPLKYLSTTQAAQIVGVSTTTMQTYISEGALRYSDIGRNGRPRIRIAEADLQAFMEQRTRTAESVA